MLEPDVPDVASWGGLPDHTPAHPVLSASSLSHNLEQDAPEERHEYYAHGQAQSMDHRQGDKHASEVATFAVQHTPSFTSDLNPNASSTTPSVSVHKSMPQSSLPQQPGTVIMQETSSYNRSKLPSKTLSENVHGRTRNSESHRRNIIEQSKVIDLTLSDEDCDQRATQITATTASRSSVNCVESLFTPPPPKKRKRTLMDYVAVPPFQKGLTKVDYLPISASPSLPVPVATGGIQYGSVHDALGAAFHQSITHIPSPGKSKEVGREPIPPSPPSAKPVVMKKSIPPFFGADVDTTENALIDAFYTQTTLPLDNPDASPSISQGTIAANTRFVFARRWTELERVLRLDEVERVMKYHLYNKCGNCASSQEGGSTSFTPMDTGHVLQQERPFWELVPPSNLPEKADDDRRQRLESVQDPIGQGVDSSPVRGAFAPSDTALSPSGAFRMGTDANMDQYLNCFSDSSIKQLSSPRKGHAPTLRFQATQPGASSLDGHATDPISLAGKDGFLGVPPSPGITETGHPPDAMPVSPFLMDGHSGDLPGFHIDEPPTPWTEMGFEQATTSSGTSCPGDNIPSFESSTIDPSLLGGEQALQAKQSGSKPRKGKPRSALPEPIVYVRRPQDALSIPCMRGNRPVQIKFRQQEHSTASDGQDAEPGVVPPSSAQNAPIGQDPKDPDWTPIPARTSSEHQRSKKLKIRVSRTSITRVESDTDSSFVPSVAGPSAVSLPKESHPKGPRGSTKGATSKTNDVVGKTEKTCCHQCRNTTDRPKMQCSNGVGDGRTCGKRFCQRCIDRRYPDITFDQFSCSFLCPSCTNTCNCSMCSRRRGEEFVSMRTGAFVGPRVQSNLTFVRDNVPAPSRDSPGMPASTSGAPNFWAHVYGLEGEHLGGAYWNRANSRPSATINRKRPPRVFVGNPQRSWKVRSTRYLDPMSDKVTAFIESLGNQGKGKGKAVDRPLRLFIGNPAALREPFERMPRTPSPASSRSSSPDVEPDDKLASPSRLEAYWPQPDVGEWCSWEPPPPFGAEFNIPGEGRSWSLALSDEQVARAIHVALAAIS